MTKYHEAYNKQRTPQSQPIPGSTQVANNAGGYAWRTTDWEQLDRFLILGCEAPTYYVTQPKLIRDNAEAVERCIAQDGQRVVARVIEVSHEGLAMRNDPALFVLALAISAGDWATRRAARMALPSVARIPTHLFQFVEYAQAMRGWGRVLRRAVGDWYLNADAARLAMHLVKYRSRVGWTHADLLAKAHPNPGADVYRRSLLQWAAAGLPTDAVSSRYDNPALSDEENAAERKRRDDELAFHMKQLRGAYPCIEGYLALREKQVKPLRAAQIIRDHRLTREMVPTEFLNEGAVWAALLEDMPLMALIRNLGKLTAVGVLRQGVYEPIEHVTKAIANAEALRKARIHPINLLMALRTYAAGQGARGSLSWNPVPQVVDALDQAFYMAFKNVPATELRWCVGVDMSGSMQIALTSNPYLSCAEASVALAMVMAKTEPKCATIGYTESIQNLPISKAQRLDDAMRMGRRIPEGTDAALPMLWALQEGIEADVFVNLTDNETWAGRVHPAQALQEYRRKMGIQAKMVVVGMVSNNVTIADPDDPDQLNVVGFDASLPRLIRQFALGWQAEEPSESETEETEDE